MSLIGVVRFSPATEEVGENFAAREMVAEHVGLEALGVGAAVFVGERREELRAQVGGVGDGDEGLGARRRGFCRRSGGVVFGQRDHSRKERGDLVEESLRLVDVLLQLSPDQR